MTIEVNQIIRSKRKTLVLIVKPDGTLLVRAPLRASVASIREFVEKNKPWIEKNQAKALAVPLPSPKQYVPGEMFLYLGATYPLEHVQGQKKIAFDDQKFMLAHSSQQQTALAFEHWYKEQARQILNERVPFYANQHGIQYRKIGITSARTRWGSCSATGSLNFSWHLILAPLEVVDYVVVHELAHTVFHNHSRRFWERVETIMPDYRKHRTWLKRHGQLLLT